MTHVFLYMFLAFLTFLLICSVVSRDNNSTFEYMSNNKDSNVDVLNIIKGNSGKIQSLKEQLDNAKNTITAMESVSDQVDQNQSDILQIKKNQSALNMSQNPSYN